VLLVISPPDVLANAQGQCVDFLLLESGVNQAMTTGKVKLRDGSRVGKVPELVEPVAGNVAERQVKARWFPTGEAKDTQLMDKQWQVFL